MNKITTLLVARHGNTFERGEPPRRVGARTDLPLTQTGEDQAIALGQYIKAHNFKPAAMFTSTLQRTMRTGALALEQAGLTAPTSTLPFLNEIDYGPDENKDEDAVIARLGQANMDAWETQGIMPPDWSPRPAAIITGWSNFSDMVLHDYSGQCIFVVTSNGIARFAQHLCQIPAALASKYGMKMATGSVSVFVHDGSEWSIKHWNIRP